ncbi:MAG: ABC transporter permease [Anaerolineaceae bacterium]|nr:ABC transporter permease [Anaerolineaceae bacterium]
MLTGVLRKKIRSDLFDNLSRTIQVVLIIAIGSVAVGTIVGSLELIQLDITTNWLKNHPASVGLALGDKGIDQDMVDTIAKFKEVDQAEAQLQTGIKWRHNTAEPWRPGLLYARDDYEDMRLFTLTLEGGDWPRNKIMTVNRGFDIKPGDALIMSVNDKERVIDIGGVTWYLNFPPPNFGGDPIFFTTKEYFADLTGKDNFTYFTASVPGPFQENTSVAAAVRIEDRIEGEDVEVYPGTSDDTKVINPAKHPAQDPVNGVFLILKIMAFAALILGLFLVFNTITAIISQQVPQIGVLKAIGATRGQILLLYYTMVFIYGLLAVLLSIPLGAVAAQGLRVWLVKFMEMDPGPFGLSSQAILIQIAICILAPLLIATLPIFKGAGITVREAISSYGLTGGGGLIDRLMAKLAFLPRMTSMAISNTFRNKTRLFMTELTLVGAGVLFIAVMSTGASIRYTFGPILFDTLRADILMSFEDPERFTEVERVARRADPSIAAVEMWAAVSGEIRVAGQPESFDDRTVTITGMPIPSSIYGPQLRAGRWLEPDDTFALVMHQNQAGEIGVGVNDWVTFDIPTKQKVDWQVVGLVNDPIDSNIIIAPREALLVANRQVGEGRRLYVQTAGLTPEQDIVVAGQLRQAFERRGLEPTASDADTLTLLAADAISSFNIIIYLLLMMAIIIAIVGGIALSGVLSINVLERRVEIGILRSIGASNNAIATLFITEGILMGWLSWLIAVLISVPFGRGLNIGVGLAVDAEMVFEYSVASVWVWFIIITVLGFVASWFPARGAIGVSVRESLSYE